MKDSNDDDEAAPATPPEPEIPFFTREMRKVDPEAVSSWVEIPLEANVIINLPRLELDRFFFMLSQITTAVDALQASVLRLSNSDIPEAQRLMTRSVDYIQSYQSNLHEFMSAIMRGAKSGGRSE